MLLETIGGRSGGREDGKKGREEQHKHFLKSRNPTEPWTARSWGTIRCAVVQ